MEIKVFEIRHTKEDEKVWVAAYTNIHALREYFSMCNVDFMDMEDEDEVVELKEEEWKPMIVTNSEHNHEEGDWESKTYEEYVKGNGVGVIAATFFND